MCILSGILSIFNRVISSMYPPSINYTEQFVGFSISISRSQEWLKNVKFHGIQHKEGIDYFSDINSYWNSTNKCEITFLTTGIKFLLQNEYNEDPPANVLGNYHKCSKTSNKKRKKRISDPQLVWFPCNSCSISMNWNPMNAKAIKLM